MARPLATSDHPRSGTNGTQNGRPASADANHRDGLETEHTPPAGNGAGLPGPGDPRDPAAGPEQLDELDHLRSENAQLRSLCLELEQALQEAAQQGGEAGWEARVREYEALLEEKSETIRNLHQELQQVRALLEELEAQAAAKAAARPVNGPIPREEELLALSEELERERRQLQEDEQTLMEQMREMEVGMAKERAEMARQRNDLQRLQGEIRHELERLEKNGALQSKIENLKTKLQDATNRRGAAPASPLAATGPAPAAPSSSAANPSKKDSLVGRWFGNQGGAK